MIEDRRKWACVHRIEGPSTRVILPFPALRQYRFVSVATRGFIANTYHKNFSIVMIIRLVGYTEYSL